MFVYNMFVHLSTDGNSENGQPKNWKQSEFLLQNLTYNNRDINTYKFAFIIIQGKFYLAAVFLNNNSSLILSKNRTYQGICINGIHNPKNMSNQSTNRMMVESIFLISSMVVFIISPLSNTFFNFDISCKKRMETSGILYI